MKRNIIRIDEEKCNGCGLCINACHEGALQLVNGKAKLITDSYCDGLGACLPSCPMDAIHIEEREADAFDEEAVQQRMLNLKAQQQHRSHHTHEAHGCNCSSESESESESHCGCDHIHSNASAPPPLACGCPGSQARTINRPVASPAATATIAHAHASTASGLPAPAATVAPESQLRQWPVQIQLVPVNAPYLEGAHLLVAADCTAYAYANIHNDFMRGKITLIGCPKLDDTNYAEKFTEILKNRNIKSITILRMQVPCCGGIVHAVKTAMVNSGRMIPWNVVVVDTEGNIVEE